MDITENGKIVELLVPTRDSEPDVLAAFVWRTVIVIIPGGGELDPMGAASAIFAIRNLTIDRVRTSVRSEEVRNWHISSVCLNRRLGQK